MTECASSTDCQMPCFTCQQDEIIVDATHWCKNCKEGICNDCVKTHRKITILKSHILVPINDLTKADTILLGKLVLQEHCNQHPKELVTVYCKEDRRLCCTVCAISTHKTCSEVVLIDEIAECYTSKILENDSQCLTSMQNNLSHAIAVEKKARKDLTDDWDGILSTANDLVRNNKQHLDDIYASFQSVVQQKKSKGIVTKDTLVQMLEDFEQKLNNHSMTMDIFQHLDARQQFISSCTIKEDITNGVETLEQNASKYKQIQMKFEINETINLLQSINNLGTIAENELPLTSLSDICQITKLSSSLQHQMFAIQSGQVALPKLNLFTASVKLLKKVTKDDLNLGNVFLYNAIFLQNGQLLATDNKNKRLLMFDSDFLFTKQYPVAGKPYSLATPADGTCTVLVVCDTNKIVSYALKENFKETSRFDVPESTRGIDLFGSKILTGEDTRINVYGKDGKKSSSFTKAKSSETYIRSCGDRFYYTDHNEVVGTVFKDSKEVLRYSHSSLKYAVGLAQDRNGNLLVAGFNSSNIHQISADGQNGRILIDKMSSIKFPVGLCCHPNRDIFVVTGSKGENTLIEIYEFCLNQL